MIAESLAGRRIAITGSTGFLGTAIVERLLRCVPDCELILIVRPGRRGAQRRVDRDIIHNDAFDRLRNELGEEEFSNTVNRQIKAVAGDVTSDGLGLDETGQQILSKCDLFIHSAAVVSFDSPLDQAVEINLLGAVRIVETLHALKISPHLIAVSTCYVAGSRRGAAPEEPPNQSPFFVDVDWRTEVDSARQIRAETEILSRSPQQLTVFRERAHAELGAAGTPALAAKTEQLRTRWINERMADAGRSRASSLGFPDAYAYTKALGEVALGEMANGIPVSIVRPSIIESAFAQPVPGWLRGFRMAEPVIISYARGLLKEFPGVPEGTIDVIPVDFVVAAISAIAARGPDPDAAPGSDIIQVASGAVNPLRYGKLVDLVRDWFTKNPIYDDHGQPISVPQWSFPGRGRVQQQLQRSGALLDRAQKILDVLPVRGRQAEAAARLEEKRDLVDRAMGYVELYGAYAECEAVYGLERLFGLWDTMDEKDQSNFCFDPRIIDWNIYAPEIHLPSVVKAARAPMKPPSRGNQSRTQRVRSQVLSPDRHLVAFDLENTLIASNVVASYSWLASRQLDARDRTRFVLKILSEAPRLLALDRKDRSDFLRYFYRRYEGAPIEQLAIDSREHLSELLLAKSFPAALRRVRNHRSLGHRTVLITGALDFVVEPLRPLFDEVICAQLGTEDGFYNGQLSAVPPTGEARYQALVDLATACNLDLRESVAYADSASDLPMLEAVGFPVAVNPETRLASIARKRGWLVEDFQKSPGMRRRLLPLAPPKAATR